MLIRNEIAVRGIVQHPKDEGKRDSTYDATVGTIISRGKTVGSSHVLGPRGVVWVVSREEFHLPKNTTALASLRTTWAHRGIFALNVGVVDPGWKGPVSTALVNFSTNDFTVHLGDPFMRLMLFEHGIATPSIDPKNPVNRDAYVDQVKKHSKGFSNSFLNMHSLVDDVSRQIFSLPKWGIQATWVGVLIAVLAIFAPVAWQVFTAVNDEKLAIAKLQQQVEQLEKEKESSKK